MVPLLQVAFGGALGAVMRYALMVGVARVFGAGFPLGTLLVNISGSFLMGVAMGFFAARSGSIWAMPLVTAGVLGGFTTFSAFSLDTVALWEQGRTVGALGYVLISVAGSILALVLGLAAMRGTPA